MEPIDSVREFGEVVQRKNGGGGDAASLFPSLVVSGDTDSDTNYNANDDNCK